MISFFVLTVAFAILTIPLAKSIKTNKDLLHNRDQSKIWQDCQDYLGSHTMNDLWKESTLASLLTYCLAIATLVLLSQVAGVATLATGIGCIGLSLGLGVWNVCLASNPKLQELNLRKYLPFGKKETEIRVDVGNLQTA